MHFEKSCRGSFGHEVSAEAQYAAEKERALLDALYSVADLDASGFIDLPEFILLLTAVADQFGLFNASGVVDFRQHFEAVRGAASSC